MVKGKTKTKINPLDPIVLNDDGDNGPDIDISFPAFANLYDILENRIEQRKIYLFDDIETYTILNVISQIHLFEKRDKKADIELFINCDGGYVLDSLALIDAMNSSPCDFKVVVLGRAASAACLIASNGTEGKRYAGRNAEFMYHQSYSDLPDVKLSDISYWRKELARIEEKCNKLFSNNTGQTLKVINEIFLQPNQDRWMTAAESKKFGIIDHILPSRRRLHKDDKKKKKSGKE